MAKSSGPDYEPLLVEHEKAKETTVDLLQCKPLSVFITRNWGVQYSMFLGSRSKRETHTHTLRIGSRKTAETE